MKRATLIAMVICGLVGSISLSQSPPSKNEAKKLYTDEEIRKLSKHEIKEALWFQYLSLPYLDVVPAGKTDARAKVFKTLGLEDDRLADFRSERDHRVVFLVWQVSPSYDICCMSDGIFSKLEFT